MKIVSVVTCLCVAVVAWISAACAKQGAPPLPSDVAALYTQIHFNGVVRVRSGTPDNVIAQQDFGSVKNGSQARFPIGSNTKLHVALSLYQLQERGFVNLSQSVADYLDAGDFVAFGWPNTTTAYCPQAPTTKPGHCEVITFEQLLGMSAGIPGGAFNDFFAPYAGSIGATVGPYLTVPLYFTPGTNFFYSNPSFMLAAYFVEKFSGMSLRDYVKEQIWDVAGMPDTRYDPYNQELEEDETQVAERFHYIDNATGRSLGHGKCTYELDPGVVNGAGGFVSTVDDEARLYFKLFNFTSMGRPFLKSPESLLAMVKPRTYTGSPRWFAQGVWSMHCTNMSSWTKPYPCFIFYEGETICSHTANFFDVSVSPPLLTQAWKNEAVLLPTAEQYRAALRNQSAGPFVEVISSWNAPAPLHEVAWATHNHWAPAPPTT